MNKHYTPVSCQMHSDLELSIMRGERISLVLDDTRITIKPLDIISRKDKGEFLLARDGDGQSLEIRLDKIRNFHSV